MVYAQAACRLAVFFCAAAIAALVLWTAVIAPWANNVVDSPDKVLEVVGVPADTTRWLAEQIRFKVQDWLGLESLRRSHAERISGLSDDLYQIRDQLSIERGRVLSLRRELGMHGQPTIHRRGENPTLSRSAAAGELFAAALQASAINAQLESRINCPTGRLASVLASESLVWCDPGSDGFAAATGSAGWLAALATPPRSGTTWTLSIVRQATGDQTCDVYEHSGNVDTVQLGLTPGTGVVRCPAPVLPAAFRPQSIQVETDGQSSSASPAGHDTIRWQQGTRVPSLQASKAGSVATLVKTHCPLLDGLKQADSLILQIELELALREQQLRGNASPPAIQSHDDLKAGLDISQPSIESPKQSERTSLSQRDARDGARAVHLRSATQPTKPKHSPPKLSGFNPFKRIKGFHSKAKKQSDALASVSAGEAVSTPLLDRLSAHPHTTASEYTSLSESSSQSTGAGAGAGGGGGGATGVAAGGFDFSELRGEAMFGQKLFQTCPASDPSVGGKSTIPGRAIRTMRDPLVSASIQFLRQHGESLVASIKSTTTDQLQYLMDLAANGNCLQSNPVDLSIERYAECIGAMQRMPRVPQERVATMELLQAVGRSHPAFKWSLPQEQMQRSACDQASHGFYQSEFRRFVRRWMYAWALHIQNWEIRRAEGMPQLLLGIDAICDAENDGGTSASATLISQHVPQLRQLASSSPRLARQAATVASMLSFLGYDVTDTEVRPFSFNSTDTRRRAALESQFGNLQSTVWTPGKEWTTAAASEPTSVQSSTMAGAINNGHKTTQSSLFARPKRSTLAMPGARSLGEQLGLPEVSWAQIVGAVTESPCYSVVASIRRGLSRNAPMLTSAWAEIASLQAGTKATAGPGPGSGTAGTVESIPKNWPLLVVPPTYSIDLMDNSSRMKHKKKGLSIGPAQGLETPTDVLSSSQELGKAKHLGMHDFLARKQLDLDSKPTTVQACSPIIHDAQHPYLRSVLPFGGVSQSCEPRQTLAVLAVDEQNQLCASQKFAAYALHPGSSGGLIPASTVLRDRACCKQHLGLTVGEGGDSAAGRGEARALHCDDLEQGAMMEQASADGFVVQRGTSSPVVVLPPALRAVASPLPSAAMRTGKLSLSIAVDQYAADNSPVTREGAVMLGGTGVGLRLLGLPDAMVEDAVNRAMKVPWGGRIALLMYEDELIEFAIKMLQPLRGSVPLIGGYIDSYTEELRLRRAWRVHGTAAHGPTMSPSSGMGSSRAQSEAIGKSLKDQLRDQGELKGEGKGEGKKRPKRQRNIAQPGGLVGTEPGGSAKLGWVTNPARWVGMNGWPDGSRENLDLLGARRWGAVWQEGHANEMHREIRSIGKVDSDLGASARASYSESKRRSIAAVVCEHMLPRMLSYRQAYAQEADHK